MIKIGVICPSEIAFRRFMPALSEIKDVEFVGVAINSNKERFGHDDLLNSEEKKVMEIERKKAQSFIDEYGGKLFNSYEEIVSSVEIDAVYIPLPPALHFYWAKKALQNNKHVLLEKPSTLSYNDSLELVSIAKSKNLALYENYMFVYHKQLQEICNIVNSGVIGDTRLIRISFGFPRRDIDDFRYKKQLGGGSLMDAGGYTLKLASYLMGNSLRIAYANLMYIEDFDVDIMGSGALINENGLVAEVAFGMDNSYKCDLEIWGSLGEIITKRILTAPKGYIPEVTIRTNGKEQQLKLSEDDTFKNSLNMFLKCIVNDRAKESSYNNILVQSKMVDDFIKQSNK